MARKITLFAVSLSLSLILLGGAMPGTANAGDDHIVKVACSTADGRVIGADTTSRPEEVPLWCGPCSPGNQCVACLAELLEEGCEFDNDLDALYLEYTGPNVGALRGPDQSGGSAVLYQLFDDDGDCIKNACEGDLMESSSR